MLARLSRPVASTARTTTALLQPTGGEPSSPTSPPSPFAGLAAAAAAGPAGGGTPGLAEALLRRMERSIEATESSIDQLKVRCCSGWPVELFARKESSIDQLKVRCAVLVGQSGCVALEVVRVVVVEALLKRMERSIVASESSIDQLKVGCC